MGVMRSEEEGGSWGVRMGWWGGLDVAWMGEGGWGSCAESRMARSSAFVGSLSLEDGVCSVEVWSSDEGGRVFWEGGWSVGGSLVELHNQPIVRWLNVVGECRWKYLEMRILKSAFRGAVWFRTSFRISKVLPATDSRLAGSILSGAP